MLHQTTELTKVQQEICFGEFIKLAAREMRISPKATVVVQSSKEMDEAVIYFYFYEKSYFRKKATQSIYVTVKKDGYVRFAGGITNFHQFRYEPLRFLKYQIANGLDCFFERKTNFEEKVVDTYYSDEVC